MVAIRPAVLKQAGRDTVAATLQEVSEGCVRQECTAGVLLRAWLSAISASMASPTHPLNRNTRPPTEAATLQLQRLLAS
jgi:hypothetical protein